MIEKDEKQKSRNLQMRIDHTLYKEARWALMISGEERTGLAFTNKLPNLDFSTYMIYR